MSHWCPLGLDKGALELREDLQGHGWTHCHHPLSGPWTWGQGCFDGVILMSFISNMHLLLILTIKGTYWYIWSIYDKDAHEWDKFGKALMGWWEGERKGSQDKVVDRESSWADSLREEPLKWGYVDTENRESKIVKWILRRHILSAHHLAWSKPICATPNYYQFVRSSV